MNQEINDVIAKHLPSAVGEQLQKVLKEAKQDKDALVVVRAQSSEATTKILSLGKEIEELKKELASHELLRVREDTVAERERNASINEMKQELAAEKRISAFATDTVLRLVRNTEFREQTAKREMVPINSTYTGMNGSQPYTTNTIISHPHETNSSISREQV